MGRGGYNCVRYSFCWLNVLVLLSGCVALGGGIWILTQYPGGMSSPVPHLTLASADVALMVLGIIIIATAFFGCCGAWCQTKCLLITYFSVVVLLLCGEFVVASLAYVFREQVGNNIRIELQKGIELHYNRSANNNLMPMWDKLQNDFHCCGVENYEDWYQISAWPLERRVPDSCCRLQGEAVEECGKRDPELWYQEGCFKAIELWLIEKLHYVGIIGFIIALIQLFGLISSMILFCTVQRERYSRTYKSYQPTS